MDRTDEYRFNACLREAHRKHYAALDACVTVLNWLSLEKGKFGVRDTFFVDFGHDRKMHLHWMCGKREVGSMGEDRFIALMLAKGTIGPMDFDLGGENMEQLYRHGT